MLLALLLALGPLTGAARAEEAQQRAGRKADSKRPGKAAKGEAPETYFAATFGQVGDESMLIYYWSRGPLFRSETVVGGHPIITIVSRDSYYTLDGLNKVGYVIRRSRSSIEGDRRRRRPFANELHDLLEQGGEKIRSEQLSGVEADVYRVTTEAGKTTLWVTSDERQLPIRIETYDRQSGRSGRLDWVKWVPGLRIEEAFFEPPPDVTLERFESYERFVERHREKPVPPTPPLFQRLVHDPER